jgi:hypothetical protein
MRRSLTTTAAAMIALGATLGLTAVPAWAEDAPKLQSQPATPGNENQKANEALSNPPQAGRTEPSATNAAGANLASDGAAKQPDGPALVNGRLNVPGAPADSQTVPAKFSQRNDQLDHTLPNWPAR